MCTYIATDTARYIVQQFLARGKPITNVKLQKILWHAWIEYYNLNEAYLFTDKFTANAYGPGITEVYFGYAKFGGKRIPYTSRPISEIPDNIRMFLDHIVLKYENVPTYSKEIKSNEKGGIWAKAYGDGIPKYILFADIAETYCKP